ncbi:molybdenum cofactor synthesis 1 isoform X2 [Lycorma delicatula]|uniref:molybdenum cofactor synthesis 1 isoform X2 n=1 Tax=Lycorma delicatula TaxID=130591 RepID=UPI003F51428F
MLRRERLRELDGLKTIAITTNGLTLTRHLLPLQRAGLDLLNISLDTLKSDRYEVITRRHGWQRVIAGIDLAVQLGFKPVKVNVVVMRGFNDDEILDFVEFTKDREVYVRFIEYMPFTGNKWNDTKMYPYREMLNLINEKYQFLTKLNDHDNDTSKAYKVPGYKGQIGFITSMSEHFCGSCNRIRLMADGSLKVCLFGNSEISLRDALRSGVSEDDLLAMIGAAIKRKKKQHAGMMNLAQMPNRPMILIGGKKNIKRNNRRLLKINRKLISNIMNIQQINYKDSYLDLKTGINKMTIFENSNLQNNLFHFNGNITRPYGFNKEVYKICIRNMNTKSPSFSLDSTDLTHVDNRGKAKMVDVGEKPITTRTAKAKAIVNVGKEASDLIQKNLIKKGDVMTVAQLAGIMGAKKTSELIPLCHNINLSKVQVDVELDINTFSVLIITSVICEGRTGVEMEALTGASIAALTIYDMCKAINKGIVIQDIHLLEKTGGVRGDYFSNDSDKS